MNRNWKFFNNETVLCCLIFFILNLDYNYYIKYTCYSIVAKKIFQNDKFDERDENEIVNENQSEIFDENENSQYGGELK